MSEEPNHSRRQFLSRFIVGAGAGGVTGAVVEGRHLPKHPAHRIGGGALFGGLGAAAIGKVAAAGDTPGRTYTRRELIGRDFEAGRQHEWHQDRLERNTDPERGEDERGR